MTDIQRYDTRFIVKKPNSGRTWILEQDYIKAMVAARDNMNQLEREINRQNHTISEQTKEIERLQNLNRATWYMYKHAKSLLSETQLLQLERLFKNDEAAE